MRISDRLIDLNSDFAGIYKNARLSLAVTVYRVVLDSEWIYGACKPQGNAPDENEPEAEHEVNNDWFYGGGNVLVTD